MLKIENLEVSYGGIKALQGISLEVRQGEIVTLIGANGAGKSTLLRAVSGLVRAKSGVITYFDSEKSIPILELAPHQIVKIGISQVPEGRMIFPNLSVSENLELGAYLRADVRGIEDDLQFIFNLFPRLKERLKQSAGTLSGGEQQMLAIGRALMAKPRLLLLDEPSLGLAPRLVQEIFVTIQEIQKSGLTILLVEQNAHMALRLAGRGYVLETGKIILEGLAEDLGRNEDVKKAYLGG